MLGGCADTARDGPEMYVVRQDDTLYSIAWRHDLDYRDLARWNNLGADYRIVVGQVIVLGPRSRPPEQVMPRAPAKTAPGPGAPASAKPEVPQVGRPRPLPLPPSESPPAAQNNAGPAAAKSAAAPNNAGPATTKPAASPKSASAFAAPRAPNGRDTASASPAVGGNSTWVWPTDVKGAPRAVPGGGILLSGRLGQDVRAASAGRVVYAGNGLRGYGNLIIVKHADGLLSAYAHNRELLVHDGQEVATGQVIARMGEGGRRLPVLYFEIRQNGRPVDPLPFLPVVK